MEPRNYYPTVRNRRLDRDTQVHNKYLLKEEELTYLCDFRHEIFQSL